MKRYLFIAVLVMAMAALAVPRRETRMQTPIFKTGPASYQNGTRVSSVDELDEDTLVTYTFEQDSTSWTVQNLTASTGYWHHDWRLAYGGSGLSWGCFDTTNFPTGVYGYIDHTLNYLVSPTIDLSTSTAPVLGFKVNVHCETPGSSPPYNGWDGANVWYSTNGGTSWTVMPMAASNGYAYNVTSAYSFGYEFGMGTNIPEWGGTSNGWRSVSFTLTQAMRVSQFKVRFAFCSDPGYNTNDDHSMFGMIVDSIRISDGATDYLYNDADTHASPSDMVAINGASISPTNWTRYQSTEGGHTLPYCMRIAEDPNFFQSALISPRIFLPTGQRYHYQFNVKCDFEDVPTAAGSNLTDLFDLWVKSTNPDSGWHRLFYDYYRPETGLGGWSFYQHGVGFVATPPSFQSDTSCDVTPWSGDTVQFRFVAYGDSANLNGSGTGCYIDDFTIVESSLAPNDAGASRLSIPYPTTVGFLTKGTVRVTNFGSNDQTNIALHWGVNGSSFPTISPIALTSGTNSTVVLRTGTLGQAVRGWTPSAAGAYVVNAFTTLTGDVTTDNDAVNFDYTLGNNPTTFTDTIFVNPANTFELGYDSHRLTQIGIYPFGSGPAVKFTPAADSIPGSSWFVTGYAIQFNGDITGSQTVNVKLYSDNNGTPGTLLRTTPVSITPAATIPAWFTTTITNTQVSGNFWVFVSGATSGDTCHVVGHPASGVFIPGHSYSYNGSVLGADSTVMCWRIHAIVTPTTSVREIPSATVPGSFELSNAYPNPFNPTTEIKFAVPMRSHVTVTVYNMAGQVVTQLVDGELNTGTYRATVNGARMASGIYFVKMNAGSFSASRKIVLVK